MYAIQAQIEIHDAPWTRSRQIPTFYLDENIQGILDEDGAVRIALEILDPTGNLQESPYHVFNITACRI
jgi:hypothetical protein